MLCADKSISLSEMVMVTFNGVAPDPEKIDVCIADGDTRAWVFPLPVTTAMLVHMYLREKGGGRGGGNGGRLAGAILGPCLAYVGGYKLRQRLYRHCHCPSSD